ncbi:MAG TPA: MBL fold metallo-hydrolase [Roseiflexaceae bacterium]|nr:MBL fold metallo-hydrolase [Roseiflexaceae bacterium]
MSQELVVRFWGVRGSYPVPGARTLRFGGNTPCVEIQAGVHTIILDAGTGIINLGGDLVRRAHASNDAPIVATIFFSHMHHDHTQGFPFFEPAYFSSSTLQMLGPRVFANDLQDMLTRSMLPPNFPISLDELAALKKMWNIADADVVLLGTTPTDISILNAERDVIPFSPDVARVSVYHSYAHPKSGVHSYRIDWQHTSVVYATDIEACAEGDEKFIAFARHANLLIHDAQYEYADYVDAVRPRQGWGHSTMDIACEIATRSEVQKLVLFHHDPTYDDAKIAAIEARAQQIFPHVEAAYEGLEIHI